MEALADRTIGGCPASHPAAGARHRQQASRWPRQRYRRAADTGANVAIGEATGETPTASPKAGQDTPKVAQKIRDGPNLLRQPIITFTSASASSSLLASLPPPRALSGLPPPLPPTIGAIA